MDSVFADSGYWIAMLDPSNELHRKATLITEQLRYRRIVTSEMVLVEFLNAMSKLGEHDQRLAVGTVTGIRNDSTIETVPQTSQRFAAAVRLYVQAGYRALLRDD